MKVNALRPASVSARQNVRQAAMEALEGRAYLTGVVLGPPTDLSAASAGVSPVFANLDDLNGDGNAELILANSSNSVSILPGLGNGHFGAATTLAVGGTPLPLFEADVNGDGKLDIISGNTNTVSVILNNGNGTYQAAQNFPALADNHAIFVTDVNGDGKADIIAVSASSSATNNIAVLIGNGDGTFQMPTEFSAPHGSLAAVTSADYNGDGKADLAVAGQVNNTVTIFTGNGNGTFTLVGDAAVGAGPTSISSADFNHDGHLDIVTANSGGGSVSVLRGTGTGGFQPALNSAVNGVPSTGGPLKVRLTNFNNDNNPDLLVLLSSGSTGDAEVELGNGDGTFHTGTLIATHEGFRDGIAAGDLNGDGLTDAVLTNRTTITSLLNITNQDTTPPTAAVDASQPANAVGSAVIQFTVTYSDNQQIDASTLGNGNLTVTDPQGHPQAAALVSQNLGNAAVVQATYQINAPGGSLSQANNGTYTVAANANSVKDANGNALAAGQIGSFVLNVAVPGNGPNLVVSAINVKLPAAVVGGAKAPTTKVVITNAGNAVAKGTIAIDLLASTDRSFSNDDVLLKTVNKKINLKPGKRIVVTIPRYKWPANINGSVFLVARADANGAIAESNESDNVGSTASPVTIAPPFVDIQNLFGAIPATFKANKTATITVPLKNLGNITASGTASVAIATTSPNILGAPGAGMGPTIATIPLHVSIKPGQTKNFRIHFKGSLLPSEPSNQLVVTVSFPGDVNPANNAATSSNSFTLT